jgi:glycosyltransferase involved in cell wall biosynthesis
MEKPRISIVVPTLNSSKYLLTTINSILAAIEYYGNADLTIVDNGSSDGSWEILSSRYSSRATVLQMKNVSIATLRNRGASLSMGESLGFIDADCLVAPDYLDQAVQVLAETRADAVGCRYSLPDCPRWVEETWEKSHARGGNGAVNYLPSGNFMVSRKAFNAVGGFDEALVTGEDTEICQRLRTAGFSIHSSTAIAAVHLGNPKTVMQFFRKQVWHGLGMFGTFRGSWLDKPVLITFTHLLLTLLAVFNLLFSHSALVWRIPFSLLLGVLAPTLAVAYRYATVGHMYRPLGSLWLYYLYLTARIVALSRILQRKTILRTEGNS